MNFALLDNLNKDIGVKQMTNDFIYTPSTTDITIRWRKLYNYIPASEQAQYQKKWKDFRALAEKTFDDVIPKQTNIDVYPFKWKKAK